MVPRRPGCRKTANQLEHFRTTKPLIIALAYRDARAHESLAGGLFVEHKLGCQYQFILKKGRSIQANYGLRRDLSVWRPNIGPKDLRQFTREVCRG